jgi:hypothetical protein
MSSVRLGSAALAFGGIGNKSLRGVSGLMTKLNRMFPRTEPELGGVSANCGAGGTTAGGGTGADCGAKGVANGGACPSAFPANTIAISSAPAKSVVALGCLKQGLESAMIVPFQRWSVTLKQLVSGRRPRAAMDAQDFGQRRAARKSSLALV